MLNFHKGSDGRYSAIGVKGEFKRLYRCYKSVTEWRAEVCRENDKIAFNNVNCDTLKQAKEICNHWNDEWKLKC